MSNSNNIPITWDEESDTNLFGSLFPNGFNNSYSQNITSIENFKINKNFQFTQFYSNEIAKNYDYKTIIYQEKLKVYTDPENTIDGGTLDEVMIYGNRFKKTIDDIQISLFISKNGATILRQYKEVIPESNEIVLFLEKDDNYNLFGSVLRCRVGLGIEKNKDLPFADIIRFSKEKHVSLTSKQVNQLIENEVYKNKTTLFSWLANVITGALDEVFTFFTETVLNGVGDFFEKTIGGAISDFKIGENRWNPNPKEGEYNPLFLPNELIENLKKSYESGNLKDQSHWIGKIIKPFDEKIVATETFFLDALQQVKVFMPKIVYNKLKSVLQFIFKQLHKVTAFLQNPEAGLQHLFFKFLKSANALLCGIINSIIDIIAGIFQIIGFLLNGISEVLKGSKDIETNTLYYGALFAEVIENIIESVRKFDFLEFIKQAVFFQIKTAVQVYKYLAKNIPEISIEEVFYYYGYIIGIILEIFLTAGSATAAKWSAKIAEITEKTLGKLATFVKAFLNKAKTILDKVLDFIELLLSNLKKGAKYIFEELSKIMDEIFGAGKKVDELPRTKAEERILAKKEAKLKKYGKVRAKGGGDITKNFAENAGIKFEMFISETKVIGQTTNHTCAATSLKMVLEDKGIEKLEDELARALKTDIEGASILEIPSALDFKRIDDVTAIAEEEIKFSKLIEKLGDGDKAIVSVFKEELGFHAVVLDKIENGKVFLRDPLPINQGSSYSMKIEDFQKIFKDKAVIIKK